MKTWIDHWEWIKEKRSYLLFVFLLCLVIYGLSNHTHDEPEAELPIDKQSLIRDITSDMGSSSLKFSMLMKENYEIFAEALSRVPLDTVGWDTVGFKLETLFLHTSILWNDRAKLDTNRVDSAWRDVNPYKLPYGWSDSAFTEMFPTYVKREWNPSRKARTKPKQLYYFTVEEYEKVKD